MVFSDDMSQYAAIWPDGHQPMHLRKKPQADLPLVFVPTIPIPCMHSLHYFPGSKMKVDDTFETVFKPRCPPLILLVLRIGIYVWI